MKTVGSMVLSQFYFKLLSQTKLHSLLLYLRGDRNLRGGYLKAWPNKTKRWGNVYFCNVVEMIEKQRAEWFICWLSLSGPLLSVIGSENGIHGIFLAPNPPSPSSSLVFFFLSYFLPVTPLSQWYEAPPEFDKEKKEAIRWHIVNIRSNMALIINYICRFAKKTLTVHTHTHRFILLSSNWRLLKISILLFMSVLTKQD